MRFSLIVICLCLSVYSTHQRSTPADDSYVAAVVEYQVLTDTGINLQNYRRLIHEAAEKDADIMVFPEMTLTQGQISVTVPINGLLKEYPIPALHPTLFDEILVNISTAARETEIYVVINVHEIVNCTNNVTGEDCPEDKVYYFNTNVVFDRSGAVIDRYRKINLFGEFTRTPALKPDLGLFTTDFGVTFGHYICFDLMFQVPAVQVVEKHNLTDIIFTTMWFSELPYLTAVQIQEAYAYAMNVNFLASGANNVRVGSAGSGIYSGKAGALVSIMPGVPTTRLLVAKVPKVPGQITEPYPGPIYDNPADLDNLVLIRDPSMPSHVSRPLVQGFQEFTLVDKEVSCRFRVRLNQRQGETQYKYRAAAFNGVRSYSGLGTGGTRICSVIACTGDQLDTCGRRFLQYLENTTGIFEELTIIATVPTPVLNITLNAKDSAYFPVTSKPTVLPLVPGEFTYEEKNQDNVTVYTLTLNNTDAELYTFAIWGRVYGWDDEEATPPLEESTSTSDASSTIEITTVTDSLITDDGDVTEETTEDPATEEPDSSVIHVLNSVLLILSLALLFIYGY